DASLGRTPTARRIGSCHNAAGCDRIIIERTYRSAVVRASRSDGFNDGNDSIRPQLVEDPEDELAFDRESGHGLAVNDRFTSLGVDDAWQDGWAVANGAHDAAAVPDICGDRL